MIRPRLRPQVKVPRLTKLTTNIPAGRCRYLLRLVQLMINNYLAVPQKIVSIYSQKPVSSVHCFCTFWFLTQIIRIVFFL